MKISLQALVFVCFLSAASPTNQMVHGVLRDWNGKPVPNARVSVSRGDKSLGETRTDARGEFTVQAPKGTFVTVSKADMYKRVEVKTKELVIVVDQMPL